MIETLLYAVLGILVYVTLGFFLILVLYPDLDDNKAIIGLWIIWPVALLVTIFRGLRWCIEAIIHALYYI